MKIPEPLVREEEVVLEVEVLEEEVLEVVVADEVVVEVVVLVDELEGMVVVVDVLVDEVRGIVLLLVVVGIVKELVDWDIEVVVEPAPPPAPVEYA